MKLHHVAFAALLFPAASLANSDPESFDLASILQNWKIKPRQENTANKSLPIIDLGYVKQQADRIETAGDVSYYVYKNIRFAAPPTGENRFRKPQPPLKHDGVVQGGSLGAAKTTCSQSLNIAGVTLPPALAGLAIGTEDCLVSYFGWKSCGGS